MGGEYVKCKGDRDEFGDGEETRKLKAWEKKVDRREEEKGSAGIDTGRRKSRWLELAENCIKAQKHNGQPHNVSHWDKPA